MRQSNTIGVDLAKNVIQVSIVTPANKELSNKELTRHKFAEFLAKQKPALVAFEACATAHHWARVAATCGHRVKIIPAIAVAPFRQGHKTDSQQTLEKPLSCCAIALSLKIHINHFAILVNCPPQRF